ncbi:MAG TPA: hypothetical protein VGW10_06900 [Solirubrobacteraceae bacterium]|nr:hypothetical protein [Solirubrobacteraceae bacterium]
MAGPIADLVLLRGLFADTALRPGMVLAARVLERDGPRGMLLLNGARVPAQLPPELVAGAALRVRVQEVSAERLTLQVLPATPPASPDAAAPTVGLPLPGGARFRVEPDEPGTAAPDAAPGRRTIALRFDSPALGRLDFLLAVDAESASARVEVAAGAAEVARSAANELRDGLASATERPASVTVRERGETLDVRA